MTDSAQQDAASATSPRRRRWRRWPWILLGVLLTPVLLLAAWTAIALSYSYSEAGPRAGHIQELSHMGWIC